MAQHKLKQGQKLTKNSTEDIRFLEINGRFLDICERYKTRIPANEEGREILYRALKFQGSHSRAQKLFLKLKNPSASRVLLAKAFESRRAGKFDLAQIQSMTAFKKAESHHLRAEANFAIAISRAEQGHLYEALAMFSAIAADELLSDYRRQLASSNEVLLLWDLGRVDVLESKLDSVPRFFRSKLQLLLATYRCDYEKVKFLIRKQDVTLTLPHQLEEVFIIAMIATQVLGEAKELSKLFNTTMGKVVLEQASKGDSKYPLDFYRLMSGEIDSDSVLRLNEFLACEERHWRLQVEVALACSLAIAKINKSEAQSVWKQEIDNVIEKYNLMSPLLPKGLSGVGPWASSLRRVLIHSSFENHEKNVVFVLSGPSLFCITPNGKQSLGDLKKSPLTLRLFQVFANSNASSLSKEFLHNRLTRVKYVPHLHQGRLLKLLKRAESVFARNNIETPWELRRDNTVHLKRRFRIE